jgi:hypothetical protein
VDGSAEDRQGPPEQVLDRHRLRAGRFGDGPSGIGCREAEPLDAVDRIRLEWMGRARSGCDRPGSIDPSIRRAIAMVELEPTRRGSRDAEETSVRQAVVSAAEEHEPGRIVIAAV